MATIGALYWLQRVTPRYSDPKTMVIHGGLFPSLPNFGPLCTPSFWIRKIPEFTW
jgi:hypothetical protein